MNIHHVFDFNKALAEGPYAWPGGYPYYFICSDCQPMSFKTAQENAGLIRDAIIQNDKHSGWKVIAMDVNWEDPELFCSHSNERIESAYAEDSVGEEDNSDREHCTRCNNQLEESQIGKCDSCQDDDA